MKSILITIIIIVSNLLGNNMEMIEHSKLNNSHIVEINGENVENEGYKVSDDYANYTDIIDLKVGEDTGILIFYTDNFEDIRIIDNR